jgi:hypothetical protein
MYKTSKVSALSCRWRTVVVLFPLLGLTTAALQAQDIRIRVLRQGS